jgi:tetratricopeptide (TPR) repeat protein
MGAYAKAEPLYQRALAIIEKALGPEHPDTAVSLNNLAFLYDEIGAYGKAEPLYQRALAIREKALGPEHPDTAQSLNNLAMVYHDLGAYAKAEPLYQRAFAIVAGGSSPEVLWHVQANLADLAAQQQRPSEAIFYGKQAVNTIQSLRGQAASLDKALQKSFLASKASVYRFVAAQLRACEKTRNFPALSIESR